MSRPYYKQFAAQRSNAKRRGIPWRLTYEQWVEWWGDDIERRGVGHNKLQMQRFLDAGGYEVGNIRKGVPRENTRTWVNVRAVGKSAKKSADHAAQLMAAPPDLEFEAQVDPEDLPISEYFATVNGHEPHNNYDPHVLAHGLGASRRR